MHFGLEDLAAFFAAREPGAPLVLATVVETTGPTYRKPGALMLLAENGEHGGLVSGGCLEGDLAGHAVAVFRDAIPRQVRYDLRDDPDLVMGLGLGCGGDLLVQLTPIVDDSSRVVLGSLFKAAAAGRSCRLLQLLAPENHDWPPQKAGGLALLDDSGHVTGDATLASTWRAADPGQQGERTAFGSPRTIRQSLQMGDRTMEVLGIDISPPPRILVCGAGPDAVPLVQQVRAMGWHCRVVDHRAAFANPARFPPGTEVIRQRPEGLATGQLSDISAAIVMSHHVGHDLSYLRALNLAPPAWVGLLGPARRRDTLLEKLGDSSMTVFGPAGLDIGAELPASVALSIVAAIHAHLNGRSGGVLGET